MMKYHKLRNKLLRVFIIMLLLVTSLFWGTGCQQDENVPWVDITASQTEGSSPLAVQFTSQSPANITDWWWFFGDGYSSTEPDPSHTYTNDGYYTVTLVGLRGNNYETCVKEDYIRVGNPPPPLSLQIQTAHVRKFDVPPFTPNPFEDVGIDESISSKVYIVDVAGEGILYWTNYRVKDKYEVDDMIPMKYEHSIWVDETECYGMLDGVDELWKFQQERTMSPNAFYPAIYRMDKEDTQVFAFCRVNIPFHQSLMFALESNTDYGIIQVFESTLTYGLEVSGMLPRGVFGYGHEWAITEVSKDIDYPKAPKIKSALEKEFGEKVFSVCIFYHCGEGQREQVLCVDAPDITRGDIKTFIAEQGFVEFASTVTPTE